MMLGAFLWGSATDDGYGWRFLPLMVMTAPWSFWLAGPLSGILDHLGIGTRIGPNLMTFLVAVVVCGGLNMVVLSLAARTIGRRNDKLSIT